MEEFNAQLKENMKKLDEELPKLKQDLVTKMEKYGSIELMANLSIQEVFAQNPLNHNPDNPMSENPFLVFLLGLFLIKNNLSAGEQKPDKVTEILESVTKYFDNFKWAISPMDPDNRQDTDMLVFLSRHKKILDDLNPHCYQYQKDDHVKRVFSKIDYFLERSYGFNVNDAIDFQYKIHERIERLLQEKSKHVGELVKTARADMNKNQSTEFVKTLESRGWDKDSFISYYGNTHFLWSSANILLINVKKFCNEENITDETKFRNYLKSVSCKIGEQFKDFDDPLSDNIILYKPIIQLDDDNFFCPKPDFLINRLDSILEFLLDDKNKVWEKYNKAKSDYLEDKAYEFFARVFSQKGLYRNLYFTFNGKQFECDLLLLHDNKIFIIESKSSHLPLSAKRGGIVSLRDSLKAIVRKAYLQGTNVRDYIISSASVNFQDVDGNTVLTINHTMEDEFFFVNVTSENLGTIGTNLKKLDVLNFFSNEEYPWSINLYDLDIVTDLLSEPSYFIHYLEQRIRAQTQDIFQSAEEIDFLGYYFRMGNFYTELLSSSEKLASIMIAPEYYGVLDDCYIFDKPKPKLPIPRQLDELIKNMQKYNQKGYTRITSLLLDFPQQQRKLIASALERKVSNTLNTGRVDGKTIALPPPYDIGFSYFTSMSMDKKFYQFAKTHSQRRKYQQKITRWAVIGRNVSDKKNFATFFMYYNYPWEFNQEREDEISHVFGDVDHE